MNPVEPTIDINDITVKKDFAFHQPENTITFQLAGEGQPKEMFRVAADGFYVRGEKLEQDPAEAKAVYDAFVSWMAGAQAAQAAPPAPRRLTEAEITLLVEDYYADVGIAPPDLIRQVERVIFGGAPQPNEFQQAVEHVTESGKTTRSYTSGDWTMVHKDRYTDLLVLEELASQPSQAEQETWTDDGGWEFPIAQPSQAVEAERLQMLVDGAKEAQAVAKIMKDFADKNPKSLMLRDFDAAINAKGAA